MKQAGHRKASSSAVMLLVSLGTIASLGAVVYGVSSSLPFLASSALSDEPFGVLNACALGSVDPPRVGFAVSSDGRSLVAFSGGQTARSDAQADGGANPSRINLDGVTAAAFDLDGGLWLARQGLYRMSGNEAKPFGDVAPIALTGTASGAVALEASGRVLAVAQDEEDHAVRGASQLPKPVEGNFSLIASSDGERVALVVSGGVFVWNAQTLKPLRAEAPCAVETAWWLPKGHTLLLSCGPDSDFALQWDVDTGSQTAAPQKKTRARSALVPGLDVYLQACEQLACTATPP